MELVVYAEYELDQAGLFDKDSDYGGMLGTSVLELIEKFAEQGHSGYSAELVTQCAARLMRYKPLTSIEQPVDADWNVCDIDESIFQHRRLSSLFSGDKGKTWYNVNLRRRCWWKPWTWARGWFVSFPYTVK